MTVTVAIRLTAATALSKVHCHGINQQGLLLEVQTHILRVISHDDLGLFVAQNF